MKPKLIACSIMLLIFSLMPSFNNSPANVILNVPDSNNEVLAAQDSQSCSVTVVERNDNGRIYYEILGTGFTPNQSVEIKAINKRTKQGNISLLTLVESNFSGVFIGFDGESFLPVQSGVWRVVAISNDCTAKTKFRVPKR
jgi:hypothetical protein